MFNTKCLTTLFDPLLLDDLYRTCLVLFFRDDKKPMWEDLPGLLPTYQSNLIPVNLMVSINGSPDSKSFLSNG